MLSHLTRLSNGIHLPLQQPLFFSLLSIGMSKRTFYKNFKDLVELEVIKPTRKIGKVTMYKINAEHPFVKKLNEIIDELSLKIAEREEKMQLTSSPH